MITKRFIEYKDYDNYTIYRSLSFERHEKELDVIVNLTNNAIIFRVVDDKDQQTDYNNLKEAIDRYNSIGISDGINVN
jgi:hypothetical protein